jgi:hypothetical protein
MTKLKVNLFDDTLVRDSVIKFLKEKLEIDAISNKKRGKIDLLVKDQKDFGIEVEHGHWTGDFWENEYYNSISNLGYPTVNITQRKEKYWLSENFNRKGEPIPNKSYKNNIFVRTNNDFTQFIVIRPEVIRSDKMKRSRFQPFNSLEIEDWLSFQRKDVETYNLINGEYILDNGELQAVD